MRSDNFNLTGKSFIACEPIDSPAGRFTAGGALASFEEASGEHVNRALEAAEKAFHEYRRFSAEARAVFLERIGAEIERLGDDLLIAANAETALPIAE